MVWFRFFIPVIVLNFTFPICTPVYSKTAFFICYEYEEITPILKGTWRYKQTKSGSFEKVSELTKSEEIRSLIETQEWI